MTDNQRHKRRFSAWLSPAAKAKMDALAQRYGTQAVVLEIAIDRMYREEFGSVEAESGEEETDENE